jgi:iron(III) transport system substrate-binding protein
MKGKASIAIILFLIVIMTSFFIIRSNASKRIKNNEIQGEELVIYSAHPIELLRSLIQEFESRTGIWVRVKSGGTGELINQIESEQDEPVADILWGGSLSTLKPQMYLFEEYISKNQEFIFDEFKNDEGMLTRFSDVPSVLMINTDLIGDIIINGYQDLLNPNLKGSIAYCSPSISSSAYEHLINMLYAMGKGNPQEG